MTICLTVIQVICGLLLIGIIMMQSGKSAGLSGAIAGVADSFMSKHEAKTADAKMAKATKWIGAVFIVLTLVSLNATTELVVPKSIPIAFAILLYSL